MPPSQTEKMEQKEHGGNFFVLFFVVVHVFLDLVDIEGSCLPSGSADSKFMYVFFFFKC